MSAYLAGSAPACPAMITSA